MERDSVRELPGARGNSTAERTMSDQDFSTKRLLSLRRLTRGVADYLRGQVKDYLAVLSPQFHLKAYFGENVEGPKDFVKGAETNFKDLKAAYEAVGKTKPFNL